MSDIVTLLEETGRQLADKVCLISDQRSLTFASLLQEVDAAASALTRHWRISRGDVVALLLPNVAEFVVGYFAALKIGAIVQPVDDRLSASETLESLHSSGCRHALVHARTLEKLGCLEKLNVRLCSVGAEGTRFDRFEHWLMERPAAIEPDRSPSDIAELIYTSGTTGEPKGVMRTHANVLAAMGNALRGFGYRPSDVVSIAMPLSHSSALTSQLLPVLTCGGTVILHQRFLAEDAVAAMRERHVSCFRGVPTMFRMLLREQNFCAAHLPTVRLLMNSSAMIDGDTLSQLRSRFPNLPIMNSYGLTEASTSTILEDCNADESANVGHPAEDVEIEIFLSDDTPADQGQEGEVCIRGPHVFEGYRGDPGRTAQVKRPDGWIRTGDFGWKDHHGDLHLVGRRDDLISCGGLKFSAAEVESCILQLETVLDVAVIAMPHPVLGEVAMAFVAMREDSADPKTVTRHCARHLASHKVPFRVTRVTAIPRNSLGKIQKTELRIEVGGSRERNP